MNPILRWLVAEVKRLWQRMEKIDYQQRIVATVVDRRILIDQGQELESEDLGIKYSSDPITELASAYDPDVTTTYPDGIGRGTLYIDGVAQEGFVLVINDSLSGIQSAVIQGDECWASRAISLPNGTGTSRVYRIF